MQTTTTTRRLAAVTAALALALAGCGGGDGGGDAAPEESGGSSELAITGTDAVAWSTTTPSVAAGDVELTLTCEAGVAHTFAIEGVDGGAELASCDAGGEDTATVPLEAGSYTFFCTVEGHRTAGMEGTLTVS